MVGERLKKWRGTRSQREAAKAAGVSQAAWQAVEAGDIKRIGLDVAARIASTVGIPLTDLIGDPQLARRLRRERKDSTPPPASQRTGTNG